MGPQRTRVAAIVLGVAAAALGLCSTLQGRGEAPFATPRTAPRDPAHVPSILAPQGGPAPAPPEPSAVPGPSPEDAAVDVRDDGEPDGSPLFPPLEVEVRLEDGSWHDAPGQFAYALRPGASGAGGPVARAELGPDGTCTLRLPAPGRYDVGAVGGGAFRWALATDVVVDGTAPARLELRMPASEPVRFVLDPSSKGMAGRPSVRLDDGQRAVPTPGRAEVRADSSELRIEDLPTTWHVPAGLRFVVDRGTDTYRGTPRPFTAPSTVTIRRDPGLFVLHVRVEPQDRVEPTQGLLTIHMEVEGGGVVDRWQGTGGTWDVRAGQRLGDAIRPYTFCQSPPASRSLVRWRGDGILAGSVEMHVPDGATVDVPIVVRRDEANPLPRPPEAIVHVEGAVLADEAGLLVVRCGDEDCDREAIEAIGRDFPLRIAADDGPLEAIAVGPGVASDPLPLEAGRRQEFALRLAGHLRVVRSVRPPDGVELVLRRKDGRAFCDGSEPPARLDAVHRIVLEEPETRIGPLPEGDVAFLVCSGSATIAEVTARVVPCRTVDLVLPLAERLGRR